MSKHWESGLPVNILRGKVPTATLWDGTIGYAFADDGGVFNDETADANSAAAADVLLMPAVPAINDAFYFGEGFSTSGTFNSLKITISTAGAGNGIAWEYWNGAWVPLTVTDATNGFATAGASLQVSWTIPADWAATIVNGQNRYWVRARATAAGATVVATQIWLGRYPTSLTNMADGDFSTFATTGTTVQAAGYSVCGKLTYSNLPNGMYIIGAKVSSWASAGNVTIGVISAAVESDTTSSNIISSSSSGDTATRCGNRLTKVENNTIVFSCSNTAAATVNWKIYELYAYQIGE